ncbi:MAG: B12-binding domain-containing radical SAM protein [Theionarchaea archaeon]|nr:B12-binding domain-containing radical SAM protein [Theionarchaea archaeon]
MKISLVVPNVTKHIHGETFEPLGILYIAAGLCDHHEVQIVDSFNRKLTLNETVKEILSFNPDVVGISITMSPTAPFGKAVAQEMNQAGVRSVVVGGTHATFAAEELASNPYIDIVVLHEGEMTFQEILKYVQGDFNLSDIKGVAFQHNGEIVKTQKREPIKDLDGIPFPARHLIPDHTIYSRHHILSSRGCVFKCIYCASSAMNQYRWRPRSPQNVLEEIEAMASLYTTTFYFADDNFPVNRERTVALCKKMVENNLEVNWACLSRIEFMDDLDLLKAMAHAGCREIFIGAESGSDEVLKKMKRNYTAEDVKRVVKLCNHTGISTTVSFIVGNPFETLKDVRKTFELASELDTPNVAFHIFTPYIGTQAFASPEEFGLTILSGNPEEFDKNKEPVVETEYLTSEQIMEFYCESFGISLRKGRQRFWRV